MVAGVAVVDRSTSPVGDDRDRSAAVERRRRTARAGARRRAHAELRCRCRGFSGTATAPADERRQVADDERSLRSRRRSTTRSPGWTPPARSGPRGAGPVSASAPKEIASDRRPRSAIASGGCRRLRGGAPRGSRARAYRSPRPPRHRAARDRRAGSEPLRTDNKRPTRHSRAWNPAQAVCRTADAPEVRERAPSVGDWDEGRLGCDDCCLRVTLALASSTLVVVTPTAAHARRLRRRAASSAARTACTPARASRRSSGTAVSPARRPGWAQTMADVGLDLPLQPVRTASPPTGTASARTSARDPTRVPSRRRSSTRRVTTQIS